MSSSAESKPMSKLMTSQFVEPREGRPIGEAALVPPVPPSHLRYTPRTSPHSVCGRKILVSILELLLIVNIDLIPNQ